MPYCLTVPPRDLEHLSSQVLVPAPSSLELSLQPPSLAGCFALPVSCLLASKCVRDSLPTACKATSELLPRGHGGGHGQWEVLSIPLSLVLPFFGCSLVSMLARGSLEYTSLSLWFLYSWLQETLSACGSHLLAVVQPSLQLAWTHIYAIFSFLSAHCASYLACFSDSLAGFFQRVSWRSGVKKEPILPGTEA